MKGGMTCMRDAELIWTISFDGFLADESYPADKVETKIGDPVGRDGYGVRIGDFDGDGCAEVLVHDRTTAWIFKLPFPAVGAPNKHAKLKPVTGQGWYAF